MDYGQKTASPSYAAGQSVAAQPSTELSSMSNEFGVVDSFYADLIGRMDSALNRIAGQRPEAVEAGSAVPPQNCHLGSMKHSLTCLQAKAKRLADLVERLESIG